MAGRSPKPKRTCSRSWMCPSASANPTMSRPVGRPKRGRRWRRWQEFMANAPPSLPPSIALPMNVDGESDERGSASLSQPPEGHELEAGGDGEEADSDGTEATNDHQRRSHCTGRTSSACERGHHHWMVARAAVPNSRDWHSSASVVPPATQDDHC
eukprot:6207544-Pleurochrysis_carterae.AAC.2